MKTLSTKKIFAVLTALLGLLLLAPMASWANPCKNVLVYYTSWSKYNSPAYNFTNLPYGELTHICYAFITPNADGSLTVPTDYMGADGVHYDGVSMVSAAHAAGVKVLLSCGGAGSTVDGNYTTLASSSSTINTFASNLLAYCQANYFDGVDIDWEYPNTTAKSTEFDNLLAGIRAQMPAPTWLLTAALSADDYEPTFLNIGTLNNYLSFFNLMCYDYHGSWLAHSGDNAPLFEDSQDPGFSHTASGVTAVNYYVSNGASASKINYGLPFYGYGFNTAGLYQSCGGNCTTTTLTYAQIAPLVGVNWTRNWDSSSDSPNLVHSGSASVISYDDSQSVSMKAYYVLNSLHVAGVFAWSADQDYNGSTQPLLDQMSQVASAGCGPTNTPTRTFTPTWTPTPVVSSIWRVNAGGPSYTDSLGNIWAADENFSGGTAATATGGPVTGTADPTLYATQRYGANFSYTFNVPAGSYQVTLKFAETYSGDYATGDRVFNVLINGTAALSSFDIYAKAGAGNKAYDQVIDNVAPSGGVITIQFTGTASTDPNAVVEALRIIPEPSTPTHTFTPTKTSTSTPTGTSTFTRTNTPVPPTSTNTSTFTSTPTRTNTMVFTPASTATSTSTPLATSTNTATRTSTAMPPTATFTSSFTHSMTPTASLTASRTSTATSSVTSTPSFTPSSTRTSSVTSTPTWTGTPTLSPTTTQTPVLSYTFTSSPTTTLSPTATQTLVPTSTPTFTNTAQNTSTQTPVPTSTYTKTSTASYTPSSTPVFSSTPTSTATFTYSPANTYSFTPTSTHTFTFTPTNSFTNTNTRTVTPTNMATATATFTFTPTPSAKKPVLYPNPVIGPGPVNLYVPLTASSDVEVNIFTTAYRKVNHLEFRNVQPGTSVPIPLTGQYGNPLADGVYYVFIRAQGLQWTVKLLVLR